MATGTTIKYSLPYPLSTDPVRVSDDIEQLANKLDIVLEEEIQDTAAAMWTGGTFSNGLNVPTYNDTTGKMSMSLAQDLRNTAAPTFAGINLIGGDLYIGPSRSIIFEGSLDDAFETTFIITDPTADRTITFQNATGTVALTSETTLQSLTNIANTTGTVSVQIGYGATTSGTTKTIEIGENGVSGSVTNINIGSSISGATGTTTIRSNSVSIPSNSISVGTISSGTWSGTTIATDKGGTGLTSFTANRAVYATSTSVLTTGILPLEAGGTNSSLTALNGGVVYSTSSGLAITPAGVSGQVLTSNGAGAPSWGALPGATTITLNGDASGSGTSSISVTLANSGVVSGTYGSKESIPVIQVDAKGRITSASSINIDSMPQILMMAGM